jgi:phosphorylcholine metabolism protein LicD
MTPFFQRTITILNRLDIPYIVGADSLVGLSEGDICKYSHNLRLYVFPINAAKLLQLSMVFLSHRIILKPKSKNGHRFYKLRFKTSLWSKDTSHVNLTLLEPTKGGYLAFVGGHDTFFSASDLAPGSINLVSLDSAQVPVPIQHESLVKKYNKELMAGFYKKHEVSFDSKSEQQAVDFMHKNIAVMNKVGISFWVEGGTLLGALRDQKLIPWDHDLDFGMRFESASQMKKLIRHLRRHFYVSVKNFPKAKKLWQLGDYRVLKIYPRRFWFLREPLCLDLFVYYEGKLPDSDELVYKYVVWNRNAFHRKEFLDSQESLSFYGKDVPVPANPEKFIEVKYGKDWRTPVKEWNVALDDGSIYRSE